MIEMDDAAVREMLEDERIGRLCMADEQGRPYALPFPFCWMDGALYVRVALTGRKGSVLSRNTRVCFEIDRFTDALDDYASVLIEGTLVEVTDAAEKERVKSVNTAKYTRLRGGYRPGHGRSRPAAEVPLRKIVGEQVSGRRSEQRLSA